MLFTELSSQGGRSTPTPLLFPTIVAATATLVLVKQALVRDLWMWSTPAARRALSHPPGRTEHTPIDLTHTLLVLLISGARLHLGAWPRLHALYLLMAARQTSIISATAPPAPAFVTNVEVDPVVSTIPVVSSQISPRQLHFARAIHNTANRLVTTTASSLLTRSDLASLSGIFVPRSLGFSFAHSNVVCSSNSLPGKLSSLRFGSQNHLFCKSSLITSD